MQPDLVKLSFLMESSEKKALNKALTCWNQNLNCCFNCNSSMHLNICRFRRVKLFCSLRWSGRQRTALPSWRWLWGACRPTSPPREGSKEFPWSSRSVISVIDPTVQGSKFIFKQPLKLSLWSQVSDGSFSVDTGCHCQALGRFTIEKSLSVLALIALFQNTVK